MTIDLAGRSSYGSNNAKSVAAVSDVEQPVGELSKNGVTGLLQAWGQGDREAGEQLLKCVYHDLRRRAARFLRAERPDHTLQPTALVHEAYLRLVGHHHVGWQNRAQFFGVASQMMRRVLVDHARRHGRAKRSGRWTKVTLDEAIAGGEAREVDLLALDDALTRLAEQDARKSRVVELRCFGGLSEADAAQVLGISIATVRRDWTVARAWLYRQMQAIDRDPSFAAAYSGIADCYSSLGSSFDVGSQPPSEVQPGAKTAALKALGLDSALADAHNSLAYAKLNYDWDWAGAEEEFKRAIELNPGYAHAYHWYAHALLSSGRLDEALAKSNRALELDPLSPIINVHLAWHYLYARQYDRALDQLAKTLELDPNYALAHWYRGLAYEQKKLYPEALREMQSAENLLLGNLGGEIRHWTRLCDFGECGRSGARDCVAEAGISAPLRQSV